LFWGQIMKRFSKFLEEKIRSPFISGRSRFDRASLLEAGGQGLIRDPFEAMEELGLEKLAGQLLDQTTLNKAYRTMQILHHPDAQGGAESPANIKSKRINAAKELLTFYVGKTLPSQRGSQNLWDFETEDWDDFWDAESRSKDDEMKARSKEDDSYWKQQEREDTIFSIKEKMAEFNASRSKFGSRLKKLQDRKLENKDLFNLYTTLKRFGTLIENNMIYLASGDGVSLENIKMIHETLTEVNTELANLADNLKEELRKRVENTELMALLRQDAINLKITLAESMKAIQSIVNRP